MATTSWQSETDYEQVVLVHGGAADLPPEERPARAAACLRAAERGREVLAAGGSALEAVQAAVQVLEDEPLLNSATGGALTEAGTLELDAAIMEGTGLRAGAVCSLPPFRHPVDVARAVLEDGRHVLYSAAGAAQFARAHGFAPADPASMITDDAREELRRVLEQRARPKSQGTVGAVARDARGGLAAATSTGGIPGKRPGRVGDSPILGAGTYADDARGAISCTGDGEGFLRLTMASRVLEGLQVGEGAEPGPVAGACLDELAARFGMTGGILVLTPSGRIAWSRSTLAMPCAWAVVGGASESAE